MMAMTMNDKKIHNLPIRVYYEDTDAGKIVYYVNYLKFAERGRTEMLRNAGFDHKILLKQYGFSFAVCKCLVDYHKPAILDDQITVETKIIKITGARIFMAQKIKRNDEILATIDITLACLTDPCLSNKGRAMRIPRQIFAALSDYI